MYVNEQPNVDCNTQLRKAMKKRANTQLRNEESLFKTYNNQPNF